jgi:diguanylate cyclase (GGDEF)-like protein
MRVTHKLFTDLAIWMLLMGLIMGGLFPLIAIQVGMPAEILLTLPFWIATLSAGLLMGFINYMLAFRVVKPRLKLLVSHMRLVESSINQATYSGDWQSCNSIKCRVNVYSEDEIGACADAFNDLVEALFASRELETAVNDFSQTLNSQLELTALAHNALDRLIEHTSALAGIVMVEEEGECITLAHQGLSETTSVKHSDYIKKAFETNEIQRINLPEDILIEAALTLFRPREVLVIPIFFKDKPLGSVVLASTQTFNSESIRLLNLLRQSLGLALNNALAHNDLQRVAALDGLTNVYNRHFGMKRLNEEFLRSQRGQSSLGLIMMDLDHFKNINDNYGHLFGDKILRATAELCRKNLRHSDFMVRYGGEEFMIILPTAQKCDAIDIAERIRGQIENLRINNEGETVQVTASFGISLYPDTPVENEEHLIKQADDLLYEAKNKGRNCVMA